MIAQSFGFFRSLTVPANLDNLTAAARAYGVTGGADNLEITMLERATEGDRQQRQDTLDMYRQVARDAGISPRIAVAAVRSAVDRAQATWGQLLDDMNAPAAVACAIRERLKTLPLANSYK